MPVGHSDGQRSSCVHVSDNGLKGIVFAQKSHKSGVHILRYRGNDQKVLPNRLALSTVYPTIAWQGALNFLSIGQRCRSRSGLRIVESTLKDGRQVALSVCPAHYRKYEARGG